LNKERNFDDALEISNKAIYYYRKAIELNLQDDRLIHKYVMAIYMKYALIIPEKNVRKILEVIWRWRIIKTLNINILSLDGLFSVPP